jgi:hypothetical protein
MGTAVTTPVAADARLTWGSAIMAAAGLGFVGYAVIFLIRNYTDSFLELGIGADEVDVSRDDIVAFSPSLYHYIGHLHVALAGFIAAAGVAVAALAWFGVRTRHMWAWITAVAIPVLGLAVGLPAHYPNDFDTLGHLGLVYADTALFVVGAALAWSGIMRSRADLP